MTVAAYSRYCLLLARLSRDFLLCFCVVCLHTSIEAEQPASMETVLIHFVRVSDDSHRKVYERLVQMMTNWVSSYGPTNCIDVNGMRLGAPLGVRSLLSCW